MAEPGHWMARLGGHREMSTDMQGWTPEARNWKGDRGNYCWRRPSENAKRGRKKDKIFFHREIINEIAG